MKQLLMAHGWDAWLELQPVGYRQGAYRGRALARRELSAQAKRTGNDLEFREHELKIGIYETRAEGA